MHLAKQGKTVDQTTAVDISEIVQRCWQTVSTKDAELLVEPSETIHADRPITEDELFRTTPRHSACSACRTRR